MVDVLVVGAGLARRILFGDRSFPAPDPGTFRLGAASE
jgi:hypothetical protein